MTSPSRRQADLLQELREAAPMPVTPQPAGRPHQGAAPEAAAPAGGRPGTALEVRVTTQRWSPLRISGVPGGGVSAALGPLRLSLRRPGD